MNNPSQEGPCYFRFGAIALSIVILDQVTKVLVHHFLRLHESRTIIEGFFTLTYIRNPGAAFGLMAGLSENFRFYFFLSASLLALIFLTVLFHKTPPQDRWTITGIPLVVGGAIGNMIDRLRLGEVIDFLDFFIGRYHWPAFNVADSAITIGIGFLILPFLVRPRPPGADDTRDTPR